MGRRKIDRAVQVNIWLPAAHHAAVRRHASARGVAAAELYREMIAAGVGALDAIDALGQLGGIGELDAELGEA